MKLSVVQIKVLEEYWQKHKEYKRLLNARESEIKPKERANDNHYNFLKDLVQALDHVKQEADSDLNSFIEVRYTSEDAFYVDWDDVSEILAISKSKAYKLRVKLMNLTAKKLGWII